MTALRLPWLAAAIVTPLVGAVLVSRVRESDRAQRWSVIIAALVQAAAIGTWCDLASAGAALALDPLDPGRWLMGRPVLVLDNLSAPLLPLGALLYLLTAVATLRTKIRRFSFPLALASLAVLMATLSCREPRAVIACLGVSSMLSYFELRFRGKPTRVYALHIALFLVLLIGGWVWMERSSVNPAPWPVFVPLTIAVLIRSGIAPFHCWVTDLFEHATFGRALLSVGPMLGAYAFVRLLVPAAPQEVLWTVGLLALVTAVYAAGMALVQREARRFYCYILLSHSALVLVGISTTQSIGFTGALCVWLSLVLSLGGFGLTLRLLEARHGRLSLATYHGLYEHTPLLAICFLLTGMASVGFPGTFGFLGSEMLVDGVVQSYPLFGIAVVLAAALNGIAVLKAYFLLFTGTRHVSSVPLEVGLRERVAVLTLAMLILGGGLFPQPTVESRHLAAETILKERKRSFPDDAPRRHEQAGEHAQILGGWRP